MVLVEWAMKINVSSSYLAKNEFFYKFRTNAIINKGEFLNKIYGKIFEKQMNNHQSQKDIDNKVLLM